MMHSSSVALLASLASFTFAWDRPNCLFTNTTDASTYDCDTKCQQTIDEATLLDRNSFGVVPFDSDFYSTAASFSPSTSKPGDLLKVEPYVNISKEWAIPGGTSLFRMQYVTVGANNESIPATGFIAFPFSTEAEDPDHAFRMVAYAHGTCGSHYGCAPSSMANLDDYVTVFPLLEHGYAVVGTDYAGLGNNDTLLRYLDGKLNGGDVFWSVVAAKKAFGKTLSDEWAAAGHSQGGGSIWGLVQSEWIANEKSYCGDTNTRFLGGVALEPGMRVWDEARTATDSSGQTSSADFSYLPADYEMLLAYDPDVVPKVFTPKFLKRVQLGKKLGTCFSGDAALINGLDNLDQIVNKGALPLYLQTIHRYQKEQSAGLRVSAKAPMLAVQSTADNTVPVEMVELGFNQTCAAGGYPVEMSVYSILDHVAMAAASAPEWLQWIADRFDGKPTVMKCTVNKRRPFDASNAWAPVG